MTPEQEAEGYVDLGPVYATPDNVVEDVSDRLVNVGFSWDDELEGWVLLS